MRNGLMMLAVGLSLLVGERVSLGQNLRQDYLRNAPRQYGPRDPWEVGVVLRNQAGWGGAFYNCDCEEHKRMSPYIHWEQQPTVCCPHGHCSDIKQQINEVKQRVRTGSCKQCEFHLCPRCGSSEPPIKSNCPDEACAGGACPLCGSSPNSTSPVERNAQLEESESKSDGWLGGLYLRR